MFFKEPENCGVAKEYFYLGLPTQTKSGIDRSCKVERWWEYDLNRAGRRSMFTNINAAIGLPEIAKMPVSLKRRAEIREYYSKIFDGAGVKYLRQDSKCINYSNYFFTVISDQRDELAKFLRVSNIYSTLRYHPLHRISLYKEVSTVCPNADSFMERALNIPIHQNLTDSNVSQIADAVTGFFK